MRAALLALAFAAPRLVAVPDLHGDSELLQRVLVLAGATDEAGAWRMGPGDVLLFLGVAPRGRECALGSLGSQGDLDVTGCLSNVFAVLRVLQLSYVLPVAYFRAILKEF